MAAPSLDQDLVDAVAVEALAAGFLEGALEGAGEDLRRASGVVGAADVVVDEPCGGKYSRRLGSGAVDISRAELIEEGAQIGVGDVAVQDGRGGLVEHAHGLQHGERMAQQLLEVFTRRDLAGRHDLLVGGNDIVIDPVQVGIERAHLAGLSREDPRQLVDEALVVGPEDHLEARLAISGRAMGGGQAHAQEGLVLDDVEVGAQLVHDEAMGIDPTFAEAIHNAVPASKEKPWRRRVVHIPPGR